MLGVNVGALDGDEQNIDRNGNIVGEALMGGIDNDENLDTLQNTIDEVLAKDAQK